MTSKTSSLIKTFESVDIEFNLNDRVLHWSPNGKYVCYATTKNIFVMNINVSMLNDPNNGCFQTVQSIESNKIHGVQSLNKMMPFKYFYRLLPMEEMNSLLCNPLVPSAPLFTDNTEIKKLVWSLSCSFHSEQNLLGALNSLGSLEILSCSSSLRKLFDISQLWYAHCHQTYFKKFTLPKNAISVKNTFLNFAGLLFVESFAWIPSSEGVKCELVCYHKLGVLSVWRFEETVGGRLEKEHVIAPRSNKKTKNKKSKKPAQLLRDDYAYDCKLVTVITEHCAEPFSVKRLFEREIRTNERVLNIEYVKLGGSKHCLSVVKDNGTIDLLEFEYKDTIDCVLDKSTSSTNASATIGTALNNSTLDSALNDESTSSVANESVVENATSLQVNKEVSLKRTSSCKENDVALENSDVAGLEEGPTHVNSNQMNGHLEVQMNGTLDNVNIEDTEGKLGSKKVAPKRKRESRIHLEEVEKKKMKFLDAMDETNGVETQLGNSINKVERTDDSKNEKDSNKNEESMKQDESELKSSESELSKTTNESNGSFSKTETISNDSQNSMRTDKNLAPAKYVVYDNTDNIVVSNLIVSYIDENVLLVFTKLSYICYVLLDKQGNVTESGHMRIQTRFITTMVKFVKNKYLVVTFENKILVISIGVGRTTETGVDSDENGRTRKSIGTKNGDNNDSMLSGNEDSIPVANEETETSDRTENVDLTNKEPAASNDSSCKHISIVIRKSIDLSNFTHTITGITNSTNNFLTVLGFRIKVKYDTYCKSSRNPCQLALTSFQSASGFLSSPLSCRSVYKQIDMMKFICLNNINFFRLNSICMNLQNVQLKYFLVKLFRPEPSEGKRSHFNEVLTQLENTVYLNHIKKCVRNAAFREDHQVWILFREWTKRAFPAEKYDLKKLTACFPTEEYNELCVICSSKMSGVESVHFAMCSAQHRVMRCSLSLVQCLESFVQCQYCLTFASKKCAVNARCVFCDALFPVN